MYTMFRIVVDTLTLTVLLFLAMVAVTLYTQDYELINAIHCKMKYESDFGYNACMFMRNSNH